MLTNEEISERFHKLSLLIKNREFYFRHKKHCTIVNKTNLEVWKIRVDDLRKEKYLPFLMQACNHALQTVRKEEDNNDG